MLIEIKCEEFRHETITFHPGLNVILGDHKATNSIGKSTMLMVIDFVFGGSSFANKDSDIVKKLGHHAYYFCLEFNGVKHKFKRETFDSRIIYKCNDKYEVGDAIDLANYFDFLNQNYNTQDMLMSFRAIISTYSRIWGKDNIESVNKPLLQSVREPDVEGIGRLIKIFDKYAEIESLETDLEFKSNEKKSLSRAQKYSLIPQIKTTKFNDNEKRIDEIRIEINEIKENLAAHATSIKELVNDEMLDLKNKKDNVLNYKLEIESQLRRIRNNLADNRFLNSKNLQVLEDFFPEVNLDKVNEIESFHGGLKKILSAELKKEEATLNSQLIEVDMYVSSVNKDISVLVNEKIDNPSVIIDRILHLSSDLSKAKNENSYFSKEKELQKAVKETKSNLEIIKEKIIYLICGLINNKVKEIAYEVYSKENVPPKLDINGNSYFYGTSDDTGTGKAYSNLILFDLAVFKMTKLPFVIHDSLLFKNIQTNAVSNIIPLYINKKQTFIAIDEIEKYAEATKQILNENMVIKLEDGKPLYKRDWR